MLRLVIALRNLPEESLYAATLFDQSHKTLRDSTAYRIHFRKNELPPVNGFWSLAAYRAEDSSLEKNRIERYSISDRTDGLKYNAYGCANRLSCRFVAATMEFIARRSGFSREQPGLLVLQGAH